MDLLDEVLSDDGRARGCGVGQTLALLDDDLRDQVATALDHPDAKHAAISRALDRRGIRRPDGRPLSQLQVATHRKGDCSCG